MTRRRLTPEERALWQKVAERTERLHPPVPQALLPEPVDAGSVRPKALRPAFAGPAGKPSTLSAGSLVPASPVAAPVQVDHKLFRKMKRGKLAPEARLDLHGMTLERAHPALTRFVLDASKKGKRLLLVITGKGRGSGRDDLFPEQRGVLRRQAPIWLASPPLSACVLQVTPAHSSHGGEGAFYVYLRRSR